MTSTQAYAIGKPYRVVAHHASHGSHNRMHQDGLPQKLGFRGAFVLGVANYGNMTRALVAHLGEAWLGRAVVEAKFIKPVCEGDVLRIETLPLAGREAEQAHEVTAHNNQFIGDNAVHSSTKAVIRNMLRVGDPVNILTLPIAKWEKKQNHWLTIYCAVRSRGEVCAEIYHTQIIKLRGAETAAEIQK
jgi:acyl dehydratase